MADMKSPKGMALLLLAKKHPDMKSSEEDAPPADDGADAGAADSSSTDAASDILDAIKSGDAASLAAALKDFMTLADTEEEPAANEPAEDEAQGESAPETEEE